MVESVNDRKANANVDAFDDIGVPLGFERATPQVHDDDEEDDEEARGPTMHFQMLTRKGNKGGVNAHSLEVPLECNFAAKTLAKEQAEIREREELTAKVLAYEDHEQQVARQEALAHARAQGHHRGPGKQQRHKQQARQQQQAQHAAQQQTPTTPAFPFRIQQ